MDCVDNYADDEDGSSTTSFIEKKGQKTLQDVWFVNKQKKTLPEEIFDFITYDEEDKKTFVAKIKDLLGLDAANVPNCIDRPGFVKWFENASTETQKQLEQNFNEATNVQLLYKKRERETDEQEVQNLRTQLMVSQKKRKLYNLNEEKKKKLFVPKVQRKEQETSIYTALFM